MLNFEIEPQLTHKTPTRIPYTDHTAELCKQIRERLLVQSNLKLPLSQTLSLLDGLSSSYLGRFLLHNKGLNGYWTSHLFQHNNKGCYENELENWLFNRSLLVAARERFFRFKDELQKRLRPNMHLASIPSGLMDDLVQLDYKNAAHCKLFAIDADVESLALARDNAYFHGVNQEIILLHRDAWRLGIENEFDMISSNGLNMYESSRDRLVELYKNFYNALKKAGTLILSFLPPPPDGTNDNYSWKNFNISEEDIQIEQALFQDIIQINYLNFCTEDEIRQQLAEAGFWIEGVSYSDKGVCPIIIAVKK